MSSLNCGQCNQPIPCPGGDIANLKKHIKAENDLNLVIALLTEGEVGEWVSAEQGEGEVGWIPKDWCPRRFKRDVLSDRK